METKTRNPLGWRPRLGLNAIAFVAAAIGMELYGAPPWAFVLLLYLCSQPSRLELADDIAALQSTIRVTPDDHTAILQATIRDTVQKAVRDLKGGR